MSEPEMKPTPRDSRIGLFADALIAVKGLLDKARFNPDLPLVGNHGLGELLLGRAPEEVNEWSYGNYPVRINPYAGQTAGLLPEVKRERKVGLLDAATLIGPTLASGTGRAMAAGLFGGGADDAARAAMVWHGSPYKFDKFDPKKIGTGEGAQAYGHGLYLADRRGVGETYKEAGVNAATFIPARSINSPEQMAATVLARARGDVNHAARVLTVQMQNGDKVAGEALALIKSGATIPGSEYIGYLYKVDLPDEQIARMLDWDKPLSQQGGVRRFEKLPDEIRPLDEMEASNVEGARLYQRLVNHYSKEARDLVRNGQYIEDTGKWAEKQASETLRQIGIPGNKYYDGGSRAAGEGTRNYVVFPGGEDFMTILERNGLPVPESLKK